MNKFLLVFFLQAFSHLALAEIPIPEDYVDLTGTYENPSCQGLDVVFGSELLGNLDLARGAKNFKLHIDQNIKGAIQNGQEFTIVTIDTYTERDVYWDSTEETRHYKTEEISKTVFDSRSGKSMNPGYSWKKDGLNFANQKIIKSRDILGYRSRTKLMTDETIKLVNKKLIVEGTIESKMSERMLLVIPTKNSTKIYHYRCVYDRLEN